MQKIFSREMRFRDENGEEFGEWKEKKLGEIGKFSK
jgi:type I restriction enzyme S subunit